MLKLTSLSDCSFQQALTLWNEGFQGYFFDMTFSMERFMARFGNEGLSAEVSVLAWANDLPVGFILNGVRRIQGKRIAWNGGTAVIPEYRRRGIGQKMMEACLDVYRAHDIDTAYLEAIANNQPAIALYEKYGYRIMDALKFLTLSVAMLNNAFSSAETPGCIVVTGFPCDVVKLDFYQAFAPWQTQWQSLSGGRSAILFDGQSSPIAYAPYKHGFNDSGDITSIALYQCEVAEHAPDKHSAVRKILREVYSPLSRDCKRLTVNIPTSNTLLINVLEGEGVTTLSEQVSMSCQLKG